MQVYFTAASKRIRKHPKFYSNLLKFLESQGFKNNNNHISDLLSKKIIRKKDTDIYQSSSNKISKANCVIADISEPSTTVGTIIEIAHDKSLPVLCICDEPKKHNIPTVILNRDSRFFTLKVYDKKNVESIIQEYFQNFIKPRIKFNVFIDSEIDNYLKRNAKRLNISKSDFFRQLVRDEMYRDE